MTDAAGVRCDATAACAMLPTARVLLANELAATGAADVDGSRTPAVLVSDDVIAWFTTCGESNDGRMTTELLLDGKRGVVA